MPSNKKIKSTIKQIGIYFILWVGIIAFFSLIRRLGTIDAPGNQSVIRPGFMVMAQLTLVISLILAMLSIISDYVLSIRRTVHMSFGKIVGLGFLLNLSMLVISFLVAYRALHVFGLRDLAPDQNTFRALFSQNMLVAGLFITVVNAVINITRAINASLGPGNLWKLVTGKYHKPMEEEYIFMFLDLTSSTTAAEKMGHIKYSQMIQDCYYDLTQPLLRNEGSIYQYVGDEAVIFWPPAIGLSDQQCLQLFFDFEGILNHRKKYYLDKYDWFPQFKAALHIGPAIVTQVGAVKREIAYHGDTLNTAARLLSRCNEKGAKVLISEKLKESIDDQQSITGQYSLKEEGIEILKGKNSQVRMLSVSSRSSN